jgi:formate dehydrogenase
VQEIEYENTIFDCDNPEPVALLERGLRAGRLKPHMSVDIFFSQKLTIMLHSALKSLARRDLSQTSRASFHSSRRSTDKVICVLYPDPETGYPPEYARSSSIPSVKHYPDGMTTPTPSAIDFTPGDLLGCVSGELGLRKFLEDYGHTLAVTADKDGENSQLDQHLRDADYVISQPFYPAYLTAQRLANAPRLKAAITAGIGSDHVDLDAARKHKVDVCEVTYCNSISVAEHVVMMILGLVRNYIPSYQVIKEGGWNIADCAQRSYDVEGMKVGTVAAGRIGLAVLKRLHPFDCQLHYCDRHRLPSEVEAQYNLTYWEDWKEMVQHMDIVTLNCPLHSETEHMVNQDTIKLFQRGAYLVNTARGKLCDKNVIAKALRDGHLAGYAGGKQQRVPVKCRSYIDLFLTSIFGRCMVSTAASSIASLA